MRPEADFVDFVAEEEDFGRRVGRRFLDLASEAAAAAPLPLYLPPPPPFAGIVLFVLLARLSLESHAATLGAVLYRTLRPPLSVHHPLFVPVFFLATFHPSPVGAVGVRQGAESDVQEYKNVKRKTRGRTVFIYEKVKHASGVIYHQ